MSNQNKINIFFSNEEEQEFNYLKILNQNPIDRIKETVALILRVYPIKKKTKGNNRINFERI